ncbi:MAG TPA: hypothetical protein VKB92_01275 [Myxococcales bacterium]|nr:hypothetical protein [Myxococcales bacterium]
MSAPKAGAPVVGFNHNVQYGPRLYHVQTEDSGLPHSHYITHLFVGGNIVASMKSSYADLVDAEPDLPKAVRILMEVQHKAMLKRLISGEFNDLAARLSAPHYEPGVLATGETGPTAVNAGAAVAPPPPPRTLAPLLPKAPRPKEMAGPMPRPAPRPAPRPQQKPVWEPAPPGASPPPAPRVPGGPLPQTTRVPPQARPPPGPPPKMTPTSSPGVRPAARAGAKPAAARPQNIFADDTKPVEAPHDDLPTLFAEELISEKSLDEVILAFLSADLEPPK